MRGKHHGDRGSSATSRRGAEANLTTAERFDRRSSSPTAFSGDESASVTIRPDETREDGANDDAAVIASPSSGGRDDVRWRKSRGRPNLRGFDSCSSRGAVNRASAPGTHRYSL